MLAGILKDINDFGLAIANRTNAKNTVIEVLVPSDIWHQMHDSVRQIMFEDAAKTALESRSVSIYCAFGVLRISANGETL